MRFLPKTLLAATALWALFSWTAPARAEVAAPRHRVALAGGFDGTVEPELGGHGYALVRYDLSGLPRRSHLAVEYNTDTARLRFDRLRIAGDWLELGAHAAYEFLFAGLLRDYYQGGRLNSARGFDAGFLVFGALLKAGLPRDNYLELAVDARRWFFDRNDSTAPSLQLPLETWVVEARLRYTFWRLEADPSIEEAHRPFWRVRGVAFGVELGLDSRSAPSPFGAVDEGGSIDVRNPGERNVLLFRQWLRAGVALHDRVRLQLYQTAGAGRGEDDLTRARVGGSNPYVVPLAGAPWAALLADLFIAVEASLHVRVWREIEVGLLVDGVALRDIARVGDRDLGFAGGVGAFADLRLGAFQIDLRAGWTPSLVTSGLGQWNVLIAFGWQWSR